MFMVAAIASASLITNAAQLAEAALFSMKEREFAFTGTVTAAMHEGSCITDSSGQTLIMDPRGVIRAANVNPGDVVAVSGKTVEYDVGIVFGDCHHARKIGHDTVPPVISATVGEVASGRCDFRIVKVRGTLREVFRDEIDPLFVYAMLTDGATSAFVVFSAGDDDGLESLQRMTGAEIEAVGISRPYMRGYRRQLGHTIVIKGAASVRPLHERPPDPFSAPEMPGLGHFDPSEIAKMGMRRVTGRVIAVCADRSFHLIDRRGDVRRIRPNGTPPRPGDFVEAAGFPETDLYHINLSSAAWRATEPFHTQTAPEESRTLASLLSDKNGMQRIAVTRHGRRIRIRGTASTVRRDSTGGCTFAVSDAGMSVLADVHPLAKPPADLSEGCEVEIAGVCIVNAETWNPYAAFPHATGVTIAVGDPGGVTILSRPPWWTTGRLGAVIAGLLALLAAVSIWNRILNRAVLRRSRQLLKEEIAHERASLKVEERTKLAVELHDALSQSLAGAALQVDAADRAWRTSPGVTQKYIDAARRTLRKCRIELRNCLWDLRSRALEEKTVAEAIRRTLAPCIEGAEVIVNCTSLCAKIPDATLHAILSIVREAAANAVRHGHATHIEVSDRMIGAALVFSIRDDGCGFDITTRPGVHEGHFGLQGMHERAGRIGASLDVSSAPGRGTTVTLTLSRQPRHTG